MFTPELVDWLRRGDRGISSETMVECFEGLPPGTLCGRHGPSHPHDPGDLWRCVQLLDAVPAYRAKLGRLRRLSPVWAGLVDQWDDLEALLREERPTGRAPRTYDRMWPILYPGKTRGRP